MLVYLEVLIFFSGCSNSTEIQPCESASLISAEHNICLSFEHNQLTNMYQDLIENKVSEGIITISTLMPTSDLQIRIVDDPQLVIPEIGMGGFNPNEHEVMLSIDAGFNDLEVTLEENVIPQLAHELHHAKRRRSVGYGNTLLEAVVSEGLADHFSIQVAEIAPPPWSVALTGEELQILIDKASNSWHQPYDRGEWFFGTGTGIPKWAGYAIGYELVKNHLSNHPDKSASTLHNEPADSFEP